MNNIRELNAQYRELQKSELVYRVDVKATNGTHSIANKTIINKIIDLLIRESQKQIKKEGK